MPVNLMSLIDDSPKFPPQKNNRFLSGVLQKVWQKNGQPRSRGCTMLVLLCMRWDFVCELF